MKPFSKYNPEIEYQPREVIQKFQEEKLQKELIYLRNHSPFYRQLFQKEHINIDKIKTIADLQDIPITTKKDLQIHNQDFICVPK